MESNQDVFISHSSADSKLAYAMCAYLEEKGIRCWIAPRDVYGGTEYAEAIIMGIRNCKIMVVLFNKNANDSIYVKNEVERAFNYKSILIPFKVDQTIPSATLELFLGSVHSLDATQGNPEDCFDLLYQNCARVLGKKERPIKEKPIPIATETKEPILEEKPVPPIITETKEPILEEKPVIPIATETKEPILEEKLVPPLSTETKESVIEEKPVLPITTETNESPVKEIPVQHQEENKSQGNQQNERKKKKRVALIVLGSLVVIALIFIFTGNNDVQPIKWVSIPAGTFMMGSPASEVNRRDNERQHQVSLSAFKMSAHEVTFAQYDAFCEATMREKPSDYSWRWRRGQYPVINVSWDDATAFAKWMGCRLPTEAEWEYACRAGSTTPFNTGENLTTEQGNYNDDEGGGNNIEVGSLAANAWGLFDMHGNVSEWCSDRNGYYPSSPQTNPRGPSKGYDRILRGGSWLTSDSDCRSASRSWYGPDRGFSELGFRLVSLQ